MQIFSEFISVLEIDFARRLSHRIILWKHYICSSFLVINIPHGRKEKGHLVVYFNSVLLHLLLSSIYLIINLIIIALTKSWSNLVCSFFNRHWSVWWDCRLFFTMDNSMFSSNFFQFVDLVLSSSQKSLTV